MSERHTKGTQVSWTAESAAGDARSVMARASDARPFRPYVYKGGDVEPPEVIRARERYRARTAELDALAAGEVTPDTAPGYEWYRELADGDALAEVTAARDRYQAALADPDPLPAPPPVTAASRCRCGYLTTAAGHRVMCGE